jgi:hypothetical protein
MVTHSDVSICEIQQNDFMDALHFRLQRFAQGLLSERNPS